MADNYTVKQGDASQTEVDKASYEKATDVHVDEVIDWAERNVAPNIGFDSWASTQNDINADLGNPSGGPLDGSRLSANPASGKGVFVHSVSISAAKIAGVEGWQIQVIDDAGGYLFSETVTAMVPGMTKSFEKPLPPLAVDRHLKLLVFPFDSNGDVITADTLFIGKVRVTTTGR